jgi:1,4-alpha-glucan branching enzyme
MVKLVEKTHNTDHPDIKRILQQLGRELLLEQASDWQFLISTWSARDYAEARFSEHHERFDRIACIIEKALENKPITNEDWNYIIAVEKSDPIFQNLEPDIWH